MILTANVSAGFNDMDCLNSVFENSVSHKGALFGLTNTIIKVKKDRCVITVEHERLKFQKNKWIIDVCREPVHIKSGTGAIEVIKKAGSCQNAQKNKEFCKTVKKIELILQDDGLIFADGEKEDLTREHGQLYCSFLILRSYLNNDFVYSHDGKYENTLIKSAFQNRKETCDVKPMDKSVQNSAGNTGNEIPSSSTGAMKEGVAPSGVTNGSIPDSKEEGRF